MKFPYGISDFKKIAAGGYLYHDRTDRIPLLEQSQSQLFIRPRRFGKSLLVSMLKHFMEEHYFRVFANRDYRWANELTIKTAFLTLLYNDLLYIMDSEPSIERRYADLTMIIRPDKRHGKLFDVLIEFKFVVLKDIEYKKGKLNGEQLKLLPREELNRIPVIAEKLDYGEQQVMEYGRKLEEKYGNVRLKRYVVVALGFERVCHKQVVALEEGN